MIDQKAAKLIENNPVAFATVTGGGKPNVIGVAYVKVVSENLLVITDNYMSQTKENLAENPEVCLAVWDSKWNGIKLVGTAKYYSSGKWRKFVQDMPVNQGFSAKGAIVVTVEKVIKLS